MDGQDYHTETLRLGDVEVRFIRLKQSGGSHYVIFPFTDSGLHISYHPNADPILQEEKSGRNLAKLDMGSVTKLDEKTLTEPAEVAFRVSEIRPAKTR